MKWLCLRSKREWLWWISPISYSNSYLGKKIDNNNKEEEEKKIHVILHRPVLNLKMVIRIITLRISHIVRIHIIISSIIRIYLMLIRSIIDINYEEDLKDSNRQQANKSIKTWRSILYTFMRVWMNMVPSQQKLWQNIKK